MKHLAALSRILVVIVSLSVIIAYVYVRGRGPMSHEVRTDTAPTESLPGESNSTSDAPDSDGTPVIPSALTNPPTLLPGSKDMILVTPAKKSPHELMPGSKSGRAFEPRDLEPEQGPAPPAAASQPAQSAAGHSSSQS